MPAKKRRRQHPPGPKPSITLAVVKRVAKRFGLGVPLEHALAAEGNSKINVATWKKALQAHPQFSPHYEAAKGKFLAKSMERLASSESIKGLCWLLERRHSDLFTRGGSAPCGGGGGNGGTAAKEMSDDELEAIAAGSGGRAAEPTAAAA